MQSIISKDSYNYFLNLFVVLLLFVTMMGSCSKQKTVSSSKIYNESYIRTLSFPGFQSGHCLKQTEDGNFLLFWIDYTDTTASQISKLAPDGSLIWKRKINGNFDGSYFVTEEDGSILISSFGTFIKLDKNGNKLIENYPNLNGGFLVSIKKFGSIGEVYMHAYSDGAGTGMPSTNEVNFIDHNGEDSIYKTITFPDAYFKCKVLRLNVFRYDNPNTYYFWGIGFPNWTGSWVANPRTFFAKINLDSTNTNLISKQVVFVDSSDFINLNDFAYLGPPFQLNCPDKSILISQSLRNMNTGIIHSHLIKMDSSLKLQWEKDIPFETSNNETHAIEHCPDGGFLAVGKTYGTDTKIHTPFFCKYDKQGNLAWKNTLTTPRFGEAWWGIQLKEGGYLFTGNTTSFGRDINEQDLFILKTDNFGNLR